MPTLLLCSVQLGITCKNRLFLFWNASKPSKMKRSFQKLGISKMQIIITCTLWYAHFMFFSMRILVPLRTLLPFKAFKWGVFSSVFSILQSLKRKTMPCSLCCSSRSFLFPLVLDFRSPDCTSQKPLAVVNVPISSHSSSPSTNIPHDFLWRFFLPESLPSPNYYRYSSYLIDLYQLSVIFQITWLSVS